MSGNTAVRHVPLPAAMLWPREPLERGGQREAESARAGASQPACCWPSRTLWGMPEEPPLLCQVASQGSGLGELEGGPEGHDCLCSHP